MSSAKLPTRQLGKNGPQVTALGFGAMGLSGMTSIDNRDRKRRRLQEAHDLLAFYGKPEADEERFKVLDKAYEMGETNWDSADVYMDNEDLIGKWFKRTGKRDEIFLATKFANMYKDGVMTRRSDPEYVREACEKSLKRLGVETIDLYYCHRVDTVTPVEKTVEAMAQLKK